jgi:hypothetical protein
MITVNFDRITNVNCRGLDYRGNDGKVYRIDFATCAENWLGQANHPEQVATNCVGERNVLAKPPYIVFYTEPPTRIEFRFSLFRCRHPWKNYHALRQQLRTTGWTTLDLT